MSTLRSGTAGTAVLAAVGFAACKFPYPDDVATVGGTVTGLWTGAAVTLRLTAGDVTEDLAVETGAAFSFEHGLVDGTSYLISVADDGPDHDCVVANGSGRVAGSDVELMVECTNLIPHTVSLSTPVTFTFDPRVTRYELPVSVLQQGVEVVVTGATLTGAAVAEQPVTIGQVSPTVALGQGTTTVPVVVSKGSLSQGYELVFDRGAAPIVEATYAQASNAGGSDDFGTGVAAWGDYAAIGAPGEDSSTSAVADEGAPDSGAVYIFRRAGSMWSQTQILKGTAITAQRRLGARVAMDRNVLVVGADNDAAGGIGAGAIYVFRLDAGLGTWREEQRIVASDRHADDHFGYAVAVDGDRIVVGAIRHDRGGTNTDYGQVYVFGRNGVTWIEEATIRDPASPMTAGFGAAVALSGDTLVARDFRANVRVYRRAGVSWTLEVVPSTCTGSAVDIEGDLLAVGDVSDASGTGQPGDQSAPNSGAVRVFSRTGAVWTEAAYLKVPNPQRDAYMGHEVALDGDTIVSGTTRTTQPAALQVFTKVGGSWVAAPPARPMVPTGSFAFAVALTSMGGLAGDRSAGPVSGGTVSFFR